jgi:hypothetical protein
MTPWTLAKETEHSQQVALFCFTAKAKEIGFRRALNETFWPTNAYIDPELNLPVPELAYFHAIPNGGNRGDTAKSRAIEGGRMKAEGVKPGVLDCFWPLVKRKDSHVYCGLYIEMKKPSVKSLRNSLAGLSDDQKIFGEYAASQGYCVRLCYSWLEAAEALEWYYNL